VWSGAARLPLRNFGHLPPMDRSKLLNPVVSPAGRARPCTLPETTGSPRFANTILVAALVLLHHSRRQSSPRLREVGGERDHCDRRGAGSARIASGKSKLDSKIAALRPTQFRKRSPARPSWTRE